MSGPAQSVQSVDRALDLLAAVASSDHAPTVADLAQRCALNRSTAWRLLATMEAHGMVERDPHGGGYRVGYGALRLGAAADVASVVRRVRPELERLSAEVGETVSLAVVKSVSLVYVDHVSVIWSRLPAVGAGPDLLALDVERQGLPGLAERRRSASGALPAALERFTEHTITDRPLLDAELDEVATCCGYARCAGEDAAFTNGVSAAALDARQPADRGRQRVGSGATHPGRAV